MVEKSVVIEKEEFLQWKETVATGLGAINLLVLDQMNHISEKEKDYLKVAHQKVQSVFNQMQKKVDENQL